MRLRWIICLFLFGMAVAVFAHSLVGGYVTLFGCVILFGIRRLEGAILQQCSAVEHATFEAHLLTELVIGLRHQLSSKSTGTAMFRGDISSVPIERAARKSFAKTR